MGDSQNMLGIKTRPKGMHTGWVYLYKIQEEVKLILGNENKTLFDFEREDSLELIMRKLPNTKAISIVIQTARSYLNLFDRGAWVA